MTEWVPWTNLPEETGPALTGGSVYSVSEAYLRNLLERGEDFMRILWNRVNVDASYGLVLVYSP